MQIFAAIERFETATPPGIHNLEAAHAIVLFFCLSGMLPAVFYSTSEHWGKPGNVTDNFIVSEDALAGITDADRNYLYTPTNAVLLREPFSALSNLAYYLSLIHI